MEGYVVTRAWLGLLVVSLTLSQQLVQGQTTTTTTTLMPPGRPAPHWDPPGPTGDGALPPALDPLTTSTSQPTPHQDPPRTILPSPSPPTTSTLRPTPQPDPPGPLPGGRPGEPGRGEPGRRPPLPPVTPKPTTTQAPFKIDPPREYRLDNQNGDPSLGRVMGLYNGTWAPVCTNYRWDNQDARVLCKSLGYDTGVAASSRHFPKPPPPTTTASPRSPDQRGEAGLAVSGPRGQRGEAGVRGPPGPPGTSPVHPPLRWALTFNCGGEERSLFDCPGRWETYCYNEAGALCFNNVTSQKGIDDVRLVAPRDLPPNNKTAIGRVEILHRGYWGGICDRTHSITQEEASVVCRQVGYRYGYKVKRSTFSIPNQGYGMFWMNGMSCEKDQTDIKDCVIGNLNLGQDTSCGSHYYDLIVICYNTSAPYYTLPIENVRLANSTSGPNWIMGRVEMQVEDTWGVVCNHFRYNNLDWTDQKAAVLCKQLGFKDGLSVRPSVFGETNKPIWFYKRACSEGATSLDQCSSPPPSTEYDCRNSGSGAICFGSGVVDECPLIPTRDSGRGERALTTTPSPKSEKCRTRLRLVGTPGVPMSQRGKAGRVEYYYKGLWGPICAKDFDDREAHVVCKILGFRTGRAMMNSSFGFGDGPNWLSHLMCAGNEDSLTACLGWNDKILGYAPCSKDHQAGVVCENKDEEENVQVRLVNKNRAGSQNELLTGVVEVLYKGHWGTICSSGWDDRDADVCCRQMGFKTGFALKNSTLGVGTRTVWLEGVMCTGKEDNIMNCEHSGWAEKSMYALCNHENDAGVQCLAENKEAEVPVHLASKGQEKAAPQASTKEDSGASRIHSTLAILFALLLTNFSVSN